MRLKLLSKLLLRKLSNNEFDGIRALIAKDPRWSSRLIVRDDGDNGDSISQCKWCKRSDKHPQTLNHLKQSKPYLCWRRRGGLECAVCVQVLATDPELNVLDRNAILEQVDADAAGQQWFDSKVSAYEDLKNAGVRKVETGRGGKEKITARNSSLQESRQFMGYFYPTKWWMVAVGEGKKPERPRMTTHFHQGKNGRSFGKGARP